MRVTEDSPSIVKGCRVWWMEFRGDKLVAANGSVVKCSRQYAYIRRDRDGEKVIVGLDHLGLISPLVLPAVLSA